jgi:toxin ParE1/3/4
VAKAVVLRRRAADDIDAAIQHYEREGGATLAGRFVDSLEQAMRHLGRHPQTGSLRYAYELGIPGLRSWPLRSFPYLAFYVETADHLDVWRLLHAARDVPAWLAEDHPS